MRGLLTIVALSGSTPLMAQEVSFRNDVMPVLSKAGCNSGTCHGNASGKGGFKLSLRGENPDADYRSIVDGERGRRLDLFQPENSLLLGKPTMQMPHAGGERFSLQDVEYSILRKWIAAGAKNDAKSAARLSKLEVAPAEIVVPAGKQTAQLKVTAIFADGKKRDVTRLTVFEPSSAAVSVDRNGAVERINFGEVTVVARFLNQQVPARIAFLPTRKNFTWQGPKPANRIDEFVFAKLRKLRLNPADSCSDLVFLRRAYLDLTGVLPAKAETQAFLKSQHKDKRSRLVDALMKREEFADVWALLWSDLLRNEEKQLDRTGVAKFHAWMKDSFLKNKPLDQFVRELIVSKGSTYKHPPANFYRALRDPFTRSESIAQVFLGYRVNCAKCHNHPFDRWTQDDYYGWANNFSRIGYKIIKNKRRDRNDKHEFDGEQLVQWKPTGDVKNVRTGKNADVRFLDPIEQPRGKAERLEELAKWLTQPGNRQFARMQANRIWARFFGRGLVDPIDDFRSTNPASHPELLKYLADELIRSKFDLRHLVRLITSSRTWQQSAIPKGDSDSANYTHTRLRRLSAEQLVDAFSRVLDTPVAFNGYPVGKRAGQIPGVRAVRLRDKPQSDGDRFLKLFGKPMRLQSCECERKTETSLSQTFSLISGPLLNQLLTAKDNRLSRLLKKPNRVAIVEFYAVALGRPPTQTELTRMAELLAAARDKRETFEDIAWAVLNSKEFLFRR